MRYDLRLNVERFCRNPRVLIYSGALCLFFWLGVVTLTSFGQVVKSGHRAADEGQETQGFQLVPKTPGEKRKLLAPALKMLEAQGVPFDPKLLLGDDWRSQLEPALARMPAMGETVRVTEPMKGVYLAGILLLPEHISLKDDTFILTRELAPDDENSTISITGNHQLFIFNIGDRRKFAAMFRNLRSSSARQSREFLNIDVEAPCAVVGIAPIYQGRIRCRGMAYLDWRNSAAAPNKRLQLTAR